jgi:hypothetical protein
MRFALFANKILTIRWYSGGSVVIISLGKDGSDSRRRPRDGGSKVDGGEQDWSSKAAPQKRSNPNSAKFGDCERLRLLPQSPRSILQTAPCFNNLPRVSTRDEPAELDHFVKVKLSDEGSLEAMSPASFETNLHKKCYSIEERY